MYLTYVNGLPTWSYTPPNVPQRRLTSARSLNRVSQSSAADRQLTAAGDNSPIRLVYGRDRIGGQILNVLIYSGYIYLQALWGYELDSIEEVTLNGSEVSSASLITNYIGTQTGVDPWMEAAFAAQTPSVDYNDTLEGYAYSVIRAPVSSFNGGLKIEAIVKGRRVYDSRKDSTNGGSGTHRLADSSTWEYSTNPALCLADFLIDSTYGEGRTLDWASVAAAATWNDTTIGSPPETHRRLDGWTLDRVMPTREVRATLAQYAGVWLVPRGTTIHFVQDKTGSYVESYAHASGEIARVEKLEKLDLASLPTICEVWYTDTTSTPWRERPARSDPVAGETVRRLSSVRMPGIQRHSQALREATERLNKLNLSDLVATITVFDKGIAHEVGDIVRITLPFGGVSAKDMRLTDPPELSGPGMWLLNLQEYDAAAYSTDVETGPSYPDTTLPDPNEVNAVTGLTFDEEIYRSNLGTWLSRGRVAWTAPDPDTFIVGYEIEIRIGDIVMHSTTVGSAETSYLTPPMLEIITYTAWIRAIGSLGNRGAWASESATFDGKLTPPSAVPSISGFSKNGSVYLQWDAADDVDVIQYEIRYGSTSSTWDDANLLDRVDALALSRDGVPAGEYRFHIKAIDSVGNYSTGTAAYVDVTIEVDRDSMMIEYAPLYFYSDASSNVEFYTLLRPASGMEWEYVVSDRSGSVSSRFTTTPLSTNYPNEMITYQGSGTSTYNTWDPRDLGIAVAGIWNVETPGLVVISGSVTVTLKVKVNSGDSYTDVTTFPHRGAYRYFTVSISTTDGAFLLKEKASIKVSILADVKREFGLVTCAATGDNTVELLGNYIRFRSLILTPYGATSDSFLVATYKDLTLSESSTNSFAVVLYSNSTTRVAGTVAYSFEGI